jgi:hypothetical protein
VRLRHVHRPLFRELGTCETVPIVADVRVVASLQPRHGRRFEPGDELEVLQSATAICSDLRGFSTASFVVAEMTTPLGVPDLTVVVPAKEALARRLAHEAPPILNRVDAAIVASVPRGRGLSMLSIAKRTQLPPDTIRRHVERLSNTATLTLAPSKAIVRPAALAPVGRIIAVEAKVRDWRKGLAQADTYALWADGSVLVLGRLATASKPAAIAMARQRGIGLVVDSKWLVWPRIHPPGARDRLWASEHLIRALRPATNPRRPRS